MTIGANETAATCDDAALFYSRKKRLLGAPLLCLVLLFGNIGAAQQRPQQQPQTAAFHSLRQLGEEIRYNDVRRQEIVRKDWLSKDAVILSVEHAQVYSVSKKPGYKGVLVTVSEFVPEENLMIIGTVYILDSIQRERALSQVHHGDFVTIVGSVYEYLLPRATENRRSEFIRFGGIVIPEKLLSPKDQAEAGANSN